MRELLTAGDVGKLVGRAPVTINEAAATGRIKIAARTRNGIRLFEPEEAERFGRTLKTLTLQTDAPQTAAQARR